MGQYQFLTFSLLTAKQELEYIQRRIEDEIAKREKVTNERDETYSHLVTLQKKYVHNTEHFHEYHSVEFAIFDLLTSCPSLYCFSALTQKLSADLPLLKRTSAMWRNCKESTRLLLTSCGFLRMTT